ncbi:hypothetical protein [Novosphingobium sp. MBES04]|uniref:hypothetical protein n=1 Tax=Novosphingobium sp. MBES04 TaxID=1206458 RepID=UPI00057D0551|nr:hypothetical protein [Novosphingobium sp. MBES04]GAM04840.1 hypothetical protein MBENS4_1838 [Novosphingobium sp. MBES04]
MSYETTIAVGAASSASRAVAELLRFAQGGEGLPGLPFGTQDPTVELVHAIVSSAEIERDGLRALPGNGWDNEICALGALIDACTRFIADRRSGVEA